MVSCQFALHYSFESEGRARRFLEVRRRCAILTPSYTRQNVSARLQPKGAFIATIPDAVRIVYALVVLPFVLHLAC